MALEQQPQRRSACWPSVRRPGALHFQSLPDPWRLDIGPVEVRAPDWILVVLRGRNQEPLELPMSSLSLIKSRSRPKEKRESQRACPLESRAADLPSKRQAHTKGQGTRAEAAQAQTSIALSRWHGFRWCWVQWDLCGFIVAKV